MVKRRNTNATCVSFFQGYSHTVDGRNPASIEMVNISVFTGFHTCQVVQDFFHQVWQDSGGLDVPLRSWRRKFEAFNASKQIKEDKHFDYRDSNEDLHQHMQHNSSILSMFFK